MLGQGMVLACGTSLFKTETKDSEIKARNPRRRLERAGAYQCNASTLPSKRPKEALRLGAEDRQTK